MDSEQIPHTLQLLDKLRRNAHLNKHSHFCASRLGQRRHVVFGLPAVIINLAIGSVFFAQMSSQLPAWSQGLGAMLALLAALLGGVQTFFNFRKNYEGHREMGNEYLAVARECERLISLYFDKLMNLEQLSAQINTLNSRYATITQRAESYIVTNKVYRKALAEQQEKSRLAPSLVEQKI